VEFLSGCLPNLAKWLVLAAAAFGVVSRAATGPALVPTTPTAAVALFKGIPTGQTPEGYPVLGSPTAPVSMTDYSDFL
jgi:hypothetical protein